ncbi:hypothetical protein BDN70DRAFT_993943 [Pholiota conissans]|uniref:Uncharacterized protein n=1 Tax=Pholiota conissans TaxID=109636 RepID=A0A9P6D0K8_9AGAR|nr:hypothetical protein BDN70DRAFT_993943 [Pholiota conissans]
MVSALECLVSLWVFLRCLFSFSWKKHPQRTSASKTALYGNDATIHPTGRGHHEKFIPLSKRETLYEFYGTERSFENSGRSMGTSGELSDKPLQRDNAFANDDPMKRNDICSIINGPEYDSSTDSSAALDHMDSLSSDATDQEGLRESIMQDILGALNSEADISDSYYADDDTSDEFLAGSPFLERNSSNWDDIDDPLNTTPPDASWKHEVAVAMHAFRNCKVDSDDILAALLPAGEQRLSFRSARRLSQRKQLQEIQEWRNDFGDDDEDDIESVLDMRGGVDYAVDSTFRFP